MRSEYLQIPNDEANTLGTVEHFFQALHGLDTVAAAQTIERQLNVTDDVRERVVDLVADAGGEATEGRQSISGHQLHFQTPLLRSIAGECDEHGFSSVH